MTCPKNPKTVLGIKTQGDHDWQPSHIDRFSHNMYRMTEYCSLCGHNRETLKYHYELIKSGFTENDIARAGYYNKVHHPNLSTA